MGHGMCLNTSTHMEFLRQVIPDLSENALWLSDCPCHCMEVPSSRAHGRVLALHPFCLAVPTLAALGCRPSRAEMQILPHTVNRADPCPAPGKGLETPCFPACDWTAACCGRRPSPLSTRPTPPPARASPSLSSLPPMSPPSRIPLPFSPDPRTDLHTVR